MDEKKIKQQKLLAIVLMACGGVLLVTTFFSNQVGRATIAGFLFLILGFFTLKKAKQIEDQLKN